MSKRIKFSVEELPKNVKPIDMSYYYQRRDCERKRAEEKYRNELKKEEESRKKMKYAEIVHPLISIWITKIYRGEALTVKDLYPFSKVSLKRRRMRKKFDKNYLRYISDRTFQAWVGMAAVTPLAGSFQRIAEFNLESDPGEPGAEGKLYYLDYQYGK